MQRMDYYCDCGSEHCPAGGKPINDHESPIVLYLVAGHVNGGGEIDASGLPPFVQRMLADPLSRLEMHALCAPRVLARLLAETVPEKPLEPDPVSPSAPSEEEAEPSIEPGSNSP